MPAPVPDPSPALGELTAQNLCFSIDGRLLVYFHDSGQENTIWRFACEQRVGDCLGVSLRLNRTEDGLASSDLQPAPAEVTEVGEMSATISLGRYRFDYADGQLEEFIDGKRVGTFDCPDVP